MEVNQKPDDKQVQPNPADDVQAPEEKFEAPLLEPQNDTPEPEGEEEQPSRSAHPLAPGGRRFEQVYAKGKQAEREAQELRERLAAAEAKLDLLTKPQTKENTETEYSWAQLEEFIAQGRISRADANAHREEVMARKLAAKVKGEFTNETRQATRDETLTRTLQDYIAAVPTIMNEGSPERVRLDEEFDWLASVQGLDSTKLDGTQRKALQLTALRNVYGPIDAIRKRSAAPVREASQGISGGTPPQAPVNKDQELLNKLTKPQVEHYKKMMRAGRYKGGWKDVVAELKFVPPVTVRR